MLAFLTVAQAQAQPDSKAAAGLSVYDEPRFRGERVFIGGDMPDLKAIAFDNRTSSVRVTGGTWEMCTDKNYRGRCLRVTGEIVSLGGTGMNDRVTSIRRIDERPARKR